LIAYPRGECEDVGEVRERVWNDEWFHPEVGRTNAQEPGMEGTGAALHVSADEAESPRRCPDITQGAEL
jgi:hypothetical protein